MAGVIEDEILCEIADEIRRLRRTRTPEQRSNIWENAVTSFLKSNGKLPKHMKIICDYKARENIGYNREFWERAGIRFDTLDKQAFIDLRTGVASYCSQHPTFE